MTSSSCAARDHVTGARPPAASVISKEAKNRPKQRTIYSYLFSVAAGSRYAARDIIYLFSVTTGSRRAVREGRLAAALLTGARPPANQRPAEPTAAQPISGLYF
jgi:hypothetical protein